jgi:cell division protein FtsB
MGNILGLQHTSEIQEVIKHEKKKCETRIKEIDDASTKEIEELTNEITELTNEITELDNEIKKLNNFQNRTSLHGGKSRKHRNYKKRTYRKIR